LIIKEQEVYSLLAINGSICLPDTSDLKSYVRSVLGPNCLRFEVSGYLVFAIIIIIELLVLSCSCSD